MLGPRICRGFDELTSETFGLLVVSVPVDGGQFCGRSILCPLGDHGSARMAGCRWLMWHGPHAIPPRVYALPNPLIHHPHRTLEAEWAILETLETLHQFSTPPQQHLPLTSPVMVPIPILSLANPLSCKRGHGLTA